MTTRRMLELAALAAGLKHLEWVDTKPGGGLMVHVCRDDSGRREDRWLPLVDDGDAFRAAVDTGLEIYQAHNDAEWSVYVGYTAASGRITYCIEPCGKDRRAATRFAIVRALAAIGEEMEKEQAACKVKKDHKIVTLTGCAAGKDGDCFHAQCPQLRDGEPAKTGRHCPLDTRDEDE